MSSAPSDSEFLHEHQDLVARNLDQIIHSNTYQLAHAPPDIFMSLFHLLPSSH